MTNLGEVDLPIPLSFHPLIGEIVVHAGPSHLRRLDSSQQKHLFLFRKLYVHIYTHLNLTP